MQILAKTCRFCHDAIPDKTEREIIMKKAILALLMATLVFTMNACTNREAVNSSDIKEELGLTAEVKDATENTAKINSAVYSLLDFENTSEYENATRGLIAAPEVLELKDANGNVIWSQKAYSFVDDVIKMMN